MIRSITRRTISGSRGEFLTLQQQSQPPRHQLSPQHREISLYEYSIRIDRSVIGGNGDSLLGGVSPRRPRRLRLVSMEPSSGIHLQTSLRHLSLQSNVWLRFMFCLYVADLFSNCRLCCFFFFCLMSSCFLFMYCWILQFNIPNLRVGTLDLLLALSDDLLKASFAHNLSWFCWNCFQVVWLDCDSCIGRRTASLKEYRTKSGDRLRNWRGRQELLAPRWLWTGFLLNLTSPGRQFALNWFFLYASKLLAYGFGWWFMISVDLCGMRQSIQQCHHWRRLWMGFMHKLPRLRMIWRYLNSFQLLSAGIDCFMW